MENTAIDTLEKVVVAYDVEGRKFDVHEYVAALCALSEAEKARAESQHEWTAFMLQPNDSEQTFGGYFSPQFTFTDPNGNLVYSPPLAYITSDAVLYWEQRYKSAVNPQMRMRYAGLVWDFKKRITGSNYDSDLYRIYVDSMLEVCNNDLSSHPVVTTTVLNRLFSLTKSQPADLEKTKAALRAFESRHADDHSVCYWACQFLLMTENKKCFTQDEIDALVRQHEDRMARLATSNAAGKIDVWTLESQCNLLADYYNSCQQRDDVRRVLKVMEEAHKKCFDPHNPMQKMGILEQIHRKYIHYGLHPEANALLTEIQQAGTDAARAMQPQEYEFKIPKEVFDQADEMFGAKAESDTARWQNFAVYFIPRRATEEQSLTQSAQQFPMRYMASTNMMDFKGRPQSVVGSYEQDPEGNLVMHITEKLNFGTHFLGIAIRKMREAGLMTPDRIMSDIIEPCPLFEESSYATLRQALDFLFNDQPVVACHLLVPQIETAIRNLVEQSGYSVIKPQKHAEKGFQLITLDDLLHKEPVEYSFQPDGAMYLRLVLTDQRSLNIRNSLCHGLLPPDSFNSGVAARLLHVLVLIGMVRSE